MRKIAFLLLLLLCLQPVSASAASMPEILSEPQNLLWPENSVASYSVTAYGDDLRYKWYIVCNGTTYDTTQFAEGQPWAGFGTSGCGASADGKTFYINGITREADGARIYCEVSNGAGRMRSREAIISVGGSALPPSIHVVASIVTEPNQPASILCAATDPKGGTVSYTWMETKTGELQDAVAMDRGAETNDTLHCDTTAPGTRYYVCMVTTSHGGSGYSSVIPVTVKQQEPAGAHHHAFGAWMVTAEPTCTESGIQARECDCGHTERGELPPTGHLWDEGKITKASTADSDGEKTYSCTKCGQTRTEAIKAAPSDPPARETPADGEQSASFPWWAAVIACLLLMGGTVGAVIYRSRKRKKR